MPYIQSNAIQMYYEIHGSGAPLILISGLGGDRTFWQPSIEPLSKYFQVIIFDSRGIGRTDAPAAAYSMDTFADDVAGLMDALQLEQAYILGFSMGGNIALQFAWKYPQRVSKLIIAASTATINTQIKLFVDAVLDVYEKGITPKQMFDLIAPWLFSNAFLSIPGNEAYLQFDENDPENQPFYAWKNQYMAQRAFDIRPKLKEIAVDTCIITGEFDVFAQLSDADTLAQGLTHASLHVIPDAGHLFNYEKPELFHSLVIDFLV